MRLQLDPQKYKPKNYVLDIRTGVFLQGVGTLNGRGTGSIVIEDSPFVLDQITHSILGRKDEDQDGGYALKFRDTDVEYNDEFTMATALYGHSYGESHVKPLTTRIMFWPGQTLFMDVLNVTDHSTELVNNYTLQIIFEGFEKWM